MINFVNDAIKLMHVLYYKQTTFSSAVWFVEFSWETVTSPKVAVADHECILQ